MEYRLNQKWIKENVPKSLLEEFNKETNKLLCMSKANEYTFRFILIKIKRKVNYNEYLVENARMKSKKIENFRNLPNGTISELKEIPNRKRNEQYLNFFKQKLNE